MFSPLSPCPSVTPAERTKSNTLSAFPVPTVLQNTDYSNQYRCTSRQTFLVQRRCNSDKLYRGTVVTSMVRQTFLPQHGRCSEKTRVVTSMARQTVTELPPVEVTKSLSQTTFPLPLRRNHCNPSCHTLLLSLPKSIDT